MEGWRRRACTNSKNSDDSALGLNVDRGVLDSTMMTRDKDEMICEGTPTGPDDCCEVSLLSEGGRRISRRGKMKNNVVGVGMVADGNDAIIEQPQDFVRNNDATKTGLHHEMIPSNNLAPAFSVLMGGCGGGTYESESKPT